MNRRNLEQIFHQYIDKFKFINSGGRDEYYKWQVCNKFPSLMKKALTASNEEFHTVLYEAKKATVNIIDSYTQPFYGLVEFSKTKPEEVRSILKDLYSDDGGDLNIQMEKIGDFFKHCNELSGDSYLYKQNSHSVSALLFLNDPEHHYMYKATQSKEFAACVEFYNDFGSGDIIKLNEYYKMCDELVSEIMNCKELLDTDSMRFDGRLKVSGGKLHPDKEKHILAFDIIYCSMVYNLYDGVSYTKRDAKERQTFLTDKAKAEALKKKYELAKADMEALIEAKECLGSMIHVGDEITHKKRGIGTVKELDGNHLTISFRDKDVLFGFLTLVANKLITVNKIGFSETVEKYKDIINRHESIPGAFEYASRALEPYEEFLE